jgi:hypothetical protein
MIDLYAVLSTATRKLLDGTEGSNKHLISHVNIPNFPPAKLGVKTTTRAASVGLNMPYIEPT